MKEIAKTTKTRRAWHKSRLHIPAPGKLLFPVQRGMAESEETMNLIEKRENLLAEIEQIKTDVIRYIKDNGKDSISDAMYTTLTDLKCKYNKVDALIRRAII